MNSTHGGNKAKRRVIWIWTTALVGTLMLLSGLAFLDFDLVSGTTGTVEALEDVSLYAPRSARVASILVRPGEPVSRGDCLAVLSSEDLDGEISRVRSELADARREEVVAEMDAAELAITGGRPGMLVAEPAGELHESVGQTLSEIDTIYQKLSLRSGASRLQVLQQYASTLRAQIDALHNRELLTLKSSGHPQLLVQRHRRIASLAAERIDFLQERLEQLHNERELLTVRSPIDGLVNEVHISDPGQWVQPGEPLFDVSDPSRGYRVRGLISDQNIDLIRSGLPVRMSSHVFNSAMEGYLHGTLESVSQVGDSGTDPSFEVVATIESTPHEPVIGSHVTMKIMIDRVGPLGLFFQQNLRKGMHTRSSTPPGPEPTTATLHEN